MQFAVFALIGFASADQLFIPNNVASGALIFASSTSQSGACAGGRCSPSNVIGLASNNATGQWVSQPGSCDPGRTETMTVDWSINFGVQYITEVRYRFGDYNAANTNLVVFDTSPMNINNPTAVTYINNEQWIVYIFEVPVTATSLSLTWSGLDSPDNNVSCQVSVRDVQVWTGPTPDGFAGPTGRSGPLSPGAIAGIVLGSIVVVALCSGIMVALVLRYKNLSKRRMQTFELNAFRGARLEDSDENAPVEMSGFEALQKRLGRSQRTRNFLESLGGHRAQQTENSPAV